MPKTYGPFSKADKAALNKDPATKAIVKKNARNEVQNDPTIDEKTRKKRLKEVDALKKGGRVNGKLKKRK